MPELPLVVRISTRVYRLLLRAYPKRFRSEFGEEMLHAFSEQLIDAMQRGGPIGVLRTWIRVLSDFCLSVAEQQAIASKGLLDIPRKKSGKAFISGMCTTLAVVLAAAYTQTVLAFREWIDSSITPEGTFLVILGTGAAPFVAITLGRWVRASRLTTTLLAAAAGGLAGLALTRIGGSLWGLAVAVVVCYPKSNAASLLFRVVILAVALPLGVLGASLAGRVLIDGGLLRWSSLLLFLGVAALQFRCAIVSKPTWMRVASASRFTRAQARAALALACAVLPLSWPVGWHLEMHRRTNAPGVQVTYPTASVSRAYSSLFRGELPKQEFHRLLSVAPGSVASELLLGSPVAFVRFQNVTPEGLRTLRHLRGVMAVEFSGKDTSDVTLNALPQLPSLTFVGLKNTNVTGSFLARRNSIKGVSAIEIRNSAFSDDGMALLVNHTTLRQLAITGTQVTTNGFEQLMRLPYWPTNIWTDVPLDFELALLRELLQRNDIAAVSWAAGALARKMPPQEVAWEIVRDLLASNDAQIRLAAFAIIDRMGTQEVPALMEALSNTSAEVRRDAAYRLYGLGPRHAAPAAPSLIEALPRPQTQWPVALALVKIGSDSAIAAASPVLVQLARHEDPELRAQAVLYGLGRVGRSDNTVVSTVVSALEDPNDNVRLAAVRALGSIGPAAAEAVPALVEKLHSPAMCLAVAETLCRIGTEDAVEAALAVLLELLDSESRDRRAEAARALGLLEPPPNERVTQALIGALQDDWLDVRLEAADALARLGHVSDAVPTLVELLESTQYPPWTRRRILESLVGMGSDDAIEAALSEVVSFLQHGDQQVQLWAVQTVGAAGPAAAMALPTLHRLASGVPSELSMAASHAIKLVGGT